MQGKGGVRGRKGLGDHKTRHASSPPPLPVISGQEDQYEAARVC